MENIFLQNNVGYLQMQTKIDNLHSHIKNIEDPHYFTYADINRAKSNIKNLYTEYFNTNLVKGTKQQLSYKNIETILSMWDSQNKNSLSQFYVNEIQKIIPDYSKTILTSAGFNQALREALEEKYHGQEDIKAKDYDYNKYDKQDQFAVLHKLVEDKLNLYATIIKSETFQNSYKTYLAMNGNASVKGQYVINDIIAWSTKGVNGLKNTNNIYLANLRDVLKTIPNNSGNQDDVINTTKLASIIRNAFNNLGGDIFGEFLGTIIGSNISDSIRTQAKRQFLKAGIQSNEVMSIKDEWLEGVTVTDDCVLKGKKIKPDRTVEYILKNGNGFVTITLPVSVKVAQSASNIKTGGKSYGKKNFHDSIPIGTLLSYLNNKQAVETLEQGWGVVFKGTKGNTEKNFISASSPLFSAYRKSWINACNTMKMYGAIRGILGTFGVYNLSGNKKVTDQIAFIQFNDRFIPATKIINNIQKYTSWNRYHVSELNNMQNNYVNLIPLDRRQQEAMNNVWKDKSATKATTHEASQNWGINRKAYVSEKIAKLYEKKMAIDFNLTKLL